MEIKKELDQYYEYSKLLYDNRSSIDIKEDQVQWAIDDNDHNRTCEYMQEFIKLTERENKLNRCKDEQEEKLVNVIKKIINDEMTDREIKECIQKDNKLIRCLLYKLEKEDIYGISSN